MNDTIETRWEQQNEAGRLSFTDGDYARAEQSFLAAIREATQLGADNVRLASSLSNLGQLKYKQKDFAQAEALFHRALAIRERVLGPEHFGLVQNINNLAALHYARGELDQAEPLFQRALGISQQHLGEGHPDVAVTLNNLARLYLRKN
jgi:tetratricopeptide (TPR) repeat protein